jgi:hemerythrin
MFMWNEEYVTGVKEIDEQHEVLFQIGAKAYILLKDDYSIDKYDKIAKIIQELKGYAMYHFETEEAYLINNGYKDDLVHELEHDKFIEKFNEIDFYHMDRHQDEYLLNILEYIYKWIDQHIHVVDKEYLKKAE